jgi:hypothetical protein
MYLYWMTLPAAKLIVPDHRGFEEVYCDAESATAFEVAQFPRAATFPEILIVWPYTVVTSSSKVTATVEPDLQPVDVEVVVELVEAVEVVVVPLPGFVVVPLPPDGVCDAGKVLVGAVEYVPRAEVDEQTEGTLEALDSPQEYGTTPARRAAAVKNDA